MKLRMCFQNLDFSGSLSSRSVATAFGRLVGLFSVSLTIGRGGCRLLLLPSYEDLRVELAASLLRGYTFEESALPVARNRRAATVR